MNWIFLQLGDSYSALLEERKMKTLGIVLKHSVLLICSPAKEPERSTDYT